jgi:hypothetical protein
MPDRQENMPSRNQRVKAAKKIVSRALFPLFRMACCDRVMIDGFSAKKKNIYINFRSILNVV